MEDTTLPISNTRPVLIDDTPKKHPLLNGLVIKNLFGYLNLDDIKVVRLVCKIWDSVAISLIRRRSKIVLKNFETDIEQFQDTFTSSTSNLHFTHFEFREGFDPSKATSFFPIYGEYIKSLKVDYPKGYFRNLCYRYQYHSSANFIWISRFINLSELHIICKDNYIRPLIHTKHLLGIKHLKLENCRIFFNSNVKISPLTICLINTDFASGMAKSERLDMLVLNAAFDFHEASEICIKVIKDWRFKLVLDVGQGEAKLKNLNLTFVQIINWETSKWSVEQMSLDSISIMRKMPMVIKELNIRSTPLFDRTTIDFSLLPPKLESLSFVTGNKIDYVCNSSVYLPNLRSLEIIIDIYKKPLSLNYFTHCPNLVSFSLKIEDVGSTFLDLKWLPYNLQKLEITNNIIIVDSRLNSDQPVRIKKFIFHPYRPDQLSVDPILSKIKPDVLVLYIAFGIFGESWKTIVDSLIGASHPTKKVIVSYSFNPRKSRTSNPPPPLANQPQFFIFESKVWRAVSSEDFNREVNI